MFLQDQARSVAGAAFALVLATACSSSPMGADPNTAIDFTVTPLSQSVAAGETGVYQITVVSKANINADVQLDLVNLPSQVSAQFDTPRMTSTQQTALLRASSLVAPGNYDLLIRGRLFSNGQVASTGKDVTVVLSVVTGAPSFNIVCESPVSVAPGATVSTVCRVSRENFTADVDLTVAPLPSYLSVFPTTIRIPSSSGGGGFALSRTTASGTPATYDLVVIATSGSTTRQSTIRVNLTSTSGPTSPGL